MKPLFFKNVRIIDPANKRDQIGTLTVKNGKISALDEAIAPKEAEIIDGHGAVLCPGLVDMRVSLGEPGAEYRESVFSAAQAAVSGGVTTIATLPDTTQAIDTPALITLMKQRGSDTNLVTLHPYGALTRGCNGDEMAEMGLLKQAGAIAFTDGARTLSNAKQMRNLLAYSRFLDALIVLHPEEPSLARGGCATSSERAVMLGLPQIPVEAESIMVARDLTLAEMTGARIHFAHISTRKSLDLIKEAKAKNLRVTCDTAPPYFTMTEEEIGEFRTYAKLSPPLRQEEDRRAVCEALSDGTIDAIASDHLPADADDKRLPFAQARAGGTGLATLLGTSLEAGLPLIETLRLLTSAPASLLNIEAGRLNIGAMADLCLFDPEERWVVNSGELKGRAQNTPFDGKSLKGKIKRTFRHGIEVYHAS